MTITVLDNMEYGSDAAARAAYVPNSPIVYTPSVDVYVSRVESDGGTIVSSSDVSSALLSASSYYNNILGWYSAQFGWKNTGSNKLSKLYDLSKNEYDFYHTNSAMYPTWTANQQNGKAGIVFDGSDDNLVKPTTAVKSIFIVFKSWSTGDSYKHLFGNNDSIAAFHGGVGTLQWYTDNPVYYSENWVNGASVAAPSVVKTTNCTILTITRTNQFYLGQLCWSQNNYSGRAFPGNIMELMLIDIKVDTPLRQTIEADLNSRWGVY